MDNITVWRRNAKTGHRLHNKIRFLLLYKANLLPEFVCYHRFFLLTAFTILPQNHCTKNPTPISFQGNPILNADFEENDQTR
jgi:hypothetical protein